MSAKLSIDHEEYRLAELLPAIEVAGKRQGL